MKLLKVHVQANGTPLRKKLEGKDLSDLQSLLLTNLALPRRSHIRRTRVEKRARLGVRTYRGT